MSDAFAVALLIPHYNQRGDLATSLRSVTFAGSLIAVVVDDGSNDDNIPYSEWIHSLGLNFRTEIILSRSNKGITHALNTGLNYILTQTDCRYIARLDCGDYNLPERFDVQYRFMEAHPQVTLCGTWCNIVSDSNPLLYILKVPATHREIKRKMLSDNCFVHPSVMFRTAAVRQFGLYPGQYPAAEDYAYFFRFVNHSVTANIPEVLMVKTRANSSISYIHRRIQLISRLKIILKHFRFHPQSMWGILKAIIFMILPVAWTERLKEKFFA
jgi:glycosyltransferase involved in cell wall biosynthesis